MPKVQRTPPASPAKQSVCSQLESESLPVSCQEDTTQASKSSISDSTPLRNVATNRGNKRIAIGSPSPSSSPAKDTSDLAKTIQDIVKTEIENLLKQFNEKLCTAISRELMPIKNELKELNESVSFINDKFETIQKEQAATYKELKVLREENTTLKETVGDLNTRLNYLEQQSRASNLELQCVPENKNEELYSIVMQLSKNVSCDLKNTDVLHCTRVAKVNQSSNRPRSIVVQLASPKTRDQLLASVIKYNKTHPKDRLQSNHLGITGPSCPVYVVEHLSPANKALHAAARRKAKEVGFKFVWVRNGRIFVRKNETSEFIFVKNMDILSKLV